jgi:gamma-D-glutamyl-L-lysine dipeptidyl-peptidase
MKAIINLPLVPLRESDNERSELYTQLLFGEGVDVIETRERWLFVRSINDNYRGWVDRKMVQLLSSQDEEQLEKLTKHTVQVPLTVCYKTPSNEKLMLPGGSIIHTNKTDEFILGEESFHLNSLDLAVESGIDGQAVIQRALQYLNAPYLWGGKSILGIDCSGLVQVVFAMFGTQLDRDASEQVESGLPIDFLSEAKAGDLAFFENDNGKIIHVGLLLNAHQIIHASGWVKIESIDSNGIISALTGEYTHKLRVIKRLI